MDTGSRALAFVSKKAVSKWAGRGSRPRPAILTQPSDALDKFAADEVNAIRSLYCVVGTPRSDVESEVQSSDDEIEIDCNSAIANMPEEVRWTVHQDRRAYLEQEP